MSDGDLTQMVGLQAKRNLTDLPEELQKTNVEMV